VLDDVAYLQVRIKVLGKVHLDFTQISCVSNSF
jgi:hypothetical protein